MKFNLNLITLALITSAGTLVAPQVIAGTQSYNLANANTQAIKFEKWVCKRCKHMNGYQGTVGVGVGYNDSDDIHSASTFATEDELAGKLDANVRFRSETGYRANIKADNLGMQNGRLDIDVGKAGQYKVALNYRQMATYSTDAAMSPYQGVESDNLTLPTGWQTAGASNDMPMLEASLNPLELSLKRRREGIGFAYQSEDSWQGYVNYQHEQKTGVKTASGSFFNQSMILPEPVDHNTDSFEAGFSFNGDGWFTAINYQGSIFENEYQQLGFDNMFNPTFGAQTNGYLALDPDNESHMLSILAQYAFDSTVLSGRVHYGQMTQDQDFLTSGYSYDLPSESLDGEVTSSGIALKMNSRLSRDLNMRASYDYFERNNDTQAQAWTQISISSVSGNVSYNLPYDYSYHKAKLSANYRLARGMKLEGGFDYRKDERNYQDRESTDEQTLWAKYTNTRLQSWNFHLKANYGERDGSQYQASTWTSSESNSLLRKYNLADRKRTQVEAQVSHSPTEEFTLDLAARYSLDDYNETQIGLTESEDISFDINANYQISKDVNVNAFYSNQVINSEQSGSNNYSTANWYGDVEDTIDVIGAGISYSNLMDDKLALGLDYTYSDSDSNTKVTQGLTGDYGDYFAKVHNLNLYAKYQASANTSLRVDYKLENYQDNDAANDIEVDDIWNVVSFGNYSHDYNAQLIMFSVQYKL